MPINYINQYSAYLLESFPMFSRNPRTQGPQGPDDATRAAQFTTLVEIIRTEIRVGVDPLRSDMQNLKIAVEDVRRQQDKMYSREMVDLKFADRDAQLKDLRADHDALVKSHEALNTRFGGQAKQLLIFTGLILSPISLLLTILFQIHALP